jgi:hypothetical protein
MSTLGGTGEREAFSVRGRDGQFRHGESREARDTAPTNHPSYSEESNPGADLVVQTSDNAAFKVHSYYLKAAR